MDCTPVSLSWVYQEGVKLSQRWCCHTPITLLSTPLVIFYCSAIVLDSSSMGIHQWACSCVGIKHPQSWFCTSWQQQNLHLIKGWSVAVPRPCLDGTRQYSRRMGDRTEPRSRPPKKKRVNRSDQQYICLLPKKSAPLSCVLLRTIIFNFKTSIFFASRAFSSFEGCSTRVCAALPTRWRRGNIQVWNWKKTEWSNKSSNEVLSSSRGQRVQDSKIVCFFAILDNCIHRAQKYTHYQHNELWLMISMRTRSHMNKRKKH